MATNGTKSDTKYYNIKVYRSFWFEDTLTDSFFLPPPKEKENWNIFVRKYLRKILNPHKREFHASFTWVYMF